MSRSFTATSATVIAISAAAFAASAQTAGVGEFYPAATAVVAQSTVSAEQVRAQAQAERSVRQVLGYVAEADSTIQPRIEGADSPASQRIEVRRQAVEAAKQQRASGFVAEASGRIS